MQIVLVLYDDTEIRSSDIDKADRAHAIETLKSLSDPSEPLPMEITDEDGNFHLVPPKEIKRSYITC